MTQLNGRTALVTGGTSGIGLATAQALAAQGATVIITGRREQQAMDEVAAGFGATAYRADVSDPAQVDDLAGKLLAQEIRLDVLVTAAGGGGFTGLVDTTLEHYADTFDRNVRGTLLTVQKALPLLNDGASVVLVGSTASAGGTANFGAYAASKAAIRSFGRTWAAELVGRRIRVNTLIPGPTATPGLFALVPAGAEDQLRESLAATVPLGRLADPAEIAAGAVFLASDASSFMTGGELVLDGGQTQV